jgi:transcriptional regulator with XRE-family HTH domain
VIREHREARGWTQADLAKRAKVTQEYIAVIETGKRKSPSLPVLRRLAKALGVPVGELLE